MKKIFGILFLFMFVITIFLPFSVAEEDDDSAIITAVLDEIKSRSIPAEWLVFMVPAHEAKIIKAWSYDGSSFTEPEVYPSPEEVFNLA